jgi:hypothetical protein
LDWWNIKAEHSAWEWAAQLAMYEVAPFGERRSDIRSAFHFANLMAVQATNIKDADFRQAVEHLCDYLPCDRDGEDFVDMDALRRMKREAV